MGALYTNSTMEIWEWRSGQGCRCCPGFQLLAAAVAPMGCCSGSPIFISATFSRWREAFDLLVGGMIEEKHFEQQ